MDVGRGIRERGRGLGLLLALGALLVTGCDGVIADPKGSAGGPGGGGGGPGGAGGLLELAPADSGLRRLTTAQYHNTVRDLFDDEVVVETELDPDLVAEEGFSLSDVGASEVTTSDRGVAQYELAAMEVAGQVFSDEARRTAVVGCSPSGADDPCVESFLSDFGRRALRRPLEPEQLVRYQALVAQGQSELGDLWRGLEFAVVSMLQSPLFIYRVELGVPTEDDMRRYDDWEMATRLSYFLWDTTPDEELLRAAEAGELSSVEGIRAQAERMVEDERARPALRRFFTEWFSLDKLDRLAKDGTTYPEYTDSLGPAMREELERVLDTLVFEEDGDFREVFTRRETFVNAELAALYGLPEVTEDGFVSVTLPEDGARGGLITSGGFLALTSRATMTSPTLRGLFIRTRLLCEEVPPPPPGVEADVPPSPDGEYETMRQRLERHRTDPECAGCHSQMDPLGLPLEHFDGIGAWRDTDKGLTLDVTGELDGTTFAGARELSGLLENDTRASTCLVRQLYRRATGHEEERGEAVVIDDVAAAFEASGFSVKSLLVAITTSDGFRFAGEPR